MDRRTEDVIPLREATRAWFLISLQTFGGPAGQIAVMERTLVEDKRWIGHQRFLFALSYCTLLPGPEAQQLATYVGWLLNGVRGALVAGILFVLPGVLALLVLSGIYVAFGDSVTEGVGDEEGGGYPPRLEALLIARGRDADVRNRGVSGETTVDGLARIDSVIAQGGSPWSTALICRCTRKSRYLRSGDVQLV